MSIFDHSKKYVWKAIYPVFPYFRNLLTFLHIAHHAEDNQRNFHLGFLHPDKTVHELIDHLSLHGFRGHVVEWIEKGQVASMRKLDSFHHQYHIRIYSDGEVCGHYEHTPESKPIKHLRGSFLEPRREDFLGVIGEWLISRDAYGTLRV